MNLKYRYESRERIKEKYKTANFIELSEETVPKMLDWISGVTTESHAMIETNLYIPLQKLVERNVAFLRFLNFGVLIQKLSNKKTKRSSIALQQ